MRVILYEPIVSILFILGTLGCQTQAPKSGSPAPQALNAWIEIDRSAFAKNIATLQSLLGKQGPRICAVMKADAYGHGVSLLIPTVIQHDIPCVAIASNAEASQARAAGFKGQLMRIRTATLEEIHEGFAFNIEESFGNLDQARAAGQLAQSVHRLLRMHLALNSAGMSRNGLDLKTPEGKREAIALVHLPGLHLVGIMTHFPMEERSDVLKSLATFRSETDWLIKAAGLDRSKLWLHTANSFAVLEVPESRLDLVRPGGLLYGDTVPSHTEYLRVMRFKTRVASVNTYPAGNTVSYDRTYVLKRPSRLANLPVGYANGYRRVFSNKGFVLIRGRRFPVIGRVTMNTTVVDVTDDPTIAAGDEVVLFGKQGTSEITQEELEKTADTILLDLYTLWGQSNPRIAVDN